MEMQEAFDRALKGVLAQGCGSVRQGGHTCLYRQVVDGKELRCAVGHLFDQVPEDVIKHNYPAYEEKMYSLFPDLPKTFLAELQRAHDRAATSVLPTGPLAPEQFSFRFRENMKDVAALFGLIYKDA